MSHYVFLRAFAQIVVLLFTSYQIGALLCPYLAMLGAEALSWLAFAFAGAAVSLGLLAIDLYRKPERTAPPAPPTP